MTNLMKYHAADLPALFDRINKNSIGMDEYFDRLFNCTEHNVKLSSVQLSSSQQ